MGGDVSEVDRRLIEESYQRLKDWFDLSGLTARVAWEDGKWTIHWMDQPTVYLLEEAAMITGMRWDEWDAGTASDEPE